MILYHRVFGDGETPLIILHGLFGSSDNWQTLAKRFAEKGRIILVDQRNHGRSFHNKEMDYDLMADDLVHLMDDMGLEKADVLGHSMGGKTVMRFAMKYPERCNQLLVADMGPGPNRSRHEEIFAGLHAVDLDELTSRSQVDDVLKTYITDVGVRMFLMKNLYWIEKGRLAWRMNLTAITDQFQKILEGIGEEQASVNGAFIRGGASDYVTDSEWPHIADQFPNCRLFTMEGAGHWLHAEKPMEFYDIVNAIIWG